MRAWVEVDLGAVVRNARRIAERSRAALLPMVKADAYGIGAIPVVRALEPLEPWGYGVATIDEAASLRSAGIARPIVLFTPLLPDEFEAAQRFALTPTLGDRAAIAKWVQTGRAWHLAIDTGMNRAGMAWDSVESIGATPEGAFTHFHSAERPDGSMEQQLGRFREAISRLPKRPRYLHAENSPALERLSGPSAWDLVRPGVFLYGVGRGAEPVASLRARVVSVRTLTPGESVSYGATYRAESERTIATLALGYADGYRRAFGNNGRAIVNDCEVPVVGNVTMDMTMIDVTGVPCVVGDVATVLGRSGTRTLDAATVAERGGVSPYELLVGLALRAKRIYDGSSGYTRGAC